MKKIKKENMKQKAKRITEFIFAFLDETLEDFSRAPHSLIRMNAELLREFLKTDWPEKKIERAFCYLKELGYLIKKKISGQDHYFLSAKGIQRILKQRIEKKIKGLKKFRNRYLVIIYDIPEKEKYKREVFRRALRELKFKKLQISVWITRYDVLEELKILIRLYGIEPYVRAMFATKPGRVL